MDLERLVSVLSIEQKVRLLAGATVWRTHAEPAVGLRAMVTSDGPVGVRGPSWDERDTSLTLPSPTALAATFDEDLVARLGSVLAGEARRKGVDILLAPTLNLHRSPYGGRHFECYSEDPLLVGRIGAAYVRGVQRGGVAATAKHYVANDSETERLTVDVRVDERTLREVYLAPFEAIGSWAVMSSYNSVNGTTMSENPLLAEPLKGEWGFDGVVVSDWGAVRSTGAAGRAAQDLAMPGPCEPWSVEALLAADIPEAAIDDKVRRLLRLASRVGALDGIPPRLVPPLSGADARALLRRTVAAGCVLVRNEGRGGGGEGRVLPLDPDRLRSVAVFGPNAAQARVQGGGSAGVFPAQVVSPLDGIVAALRGRAVVAYETGVQFDGRPTPVDTGNATDPRTGAAGVLVRLLAGDGTEIHAEHRLSGNIIESSRRHAAMAASMEIHARVRATEAGAWRLGVVGLGAVSLVVDGVPVFDGVIVPDHDDPAAVHVNPPYRRVEVELEAGQEVEVVARRVFEPGTGHVLALCADPPRLDDDVMLRTAADVAASCDAAIVVVGTTDAIESEGFDRASLELPGRQDDLVEAVAAANPNTVVVVNAGGPVLLPWRERVPAVLLAWFPGQEAGDGLADVLFGAAEPGGRLPTTWPRTADTVLTTKPEEGVLRYGEGLDVGYRGYLRAGDEPAYWFGHGLGYTAWAYESISCERESVSGDDPLIVRIAVRNVGERTGTELVQVYLERPDSEVVRPVRWLAGFAHVSAGPKEPVDAVVRLPRRVFQHWSPETGQWVTEPGEFTVRAGRSAADLPLAAITVPWTETGSPH